MRSIRYSRSGPGESMTFGDPSSPHISLRAEKLEHLPVHITQLLIASKSVASLNRPSISCVLCEHFEIT